MIRNYFPQLFSGVCIAQIVVPVAVGLFWLYQILWPPSVGREFDFAAFMMFTFGGFAVTIPISLLIGLPLLILLFRHQKLNLLSVGLVSGFLGLVPLTVEGDLSLLMVSMPFAVFGGLVFWLYISWTGILTSQENSASGSDAPTTRARS